MVLVTSIQHWLIQLGIPFWIAMLLFIKAIWLRQTAGEVARSMGLLILYFHLFWLPSHTDFGDGSSTQGYPLAARVVYFVTGMSDNIEDSSFKVSQLISVVSFHPSSANSAIGRLYNRFDEWCFTPAMQEEQVSIWSQQGDQIKPTDTLESQWFGGKKLTQTPGLYVDCHKADTDYCVDGSHKAPMRFLYSQSAQSRDIYLQNSPLEGSSISCASWWESSVKPQLSKASNYYSSLALDEQSKAWSQVRLFNYIWLLQHQSDSVTHLKPAENWLELWISSWSSGGYSQQLPLQTWHREAASYLRLLGQIDFNLRMRSFSTMVAQWVTQLLLLVLPLMVLINRSVLLHIFLWSGYILLGNPIWFGARVDYIVDKSLEPFLQPSRFPPNSWEVLNEDWLGVLSIWWLPLLFLSGLVLLGIIQGILMGIQKHWLMYPR